MTPYFTAYHIYRVIRWFLCAALQSLQSLQSLSIRLPPRSTPSFNKCVQSHVQKHSLELAPAFFGLCPKAKRKLVPLGGL